MNYFYSGNWVHECTKDTSDCEQDALSCTCYFSVFHSGKQWLAFSPYCLSKYQANLYKGQFVRAACQSCRQATFMLMHRNITSKLHLFWLRWMLFHERSSIFTSSANIKIHLTLKTGQNEQKAPILCYFISFCKYIICSAVFFVTWPRCITQVLTDVFWAFSCCSGFFNINGFSIPHMQAVSLTTQAGCQVHTLMWENLVCTALCREVQVIDMFVKKSLEEIVNCKRILIKKYCLLFEFAYIQHDN